MTSAGFQRSFCVKRLVVGIYHTIDDRLESAHFSLVPFQLTAPSAPIPNQSDIQTRDASPARKSNYGQ